jgi:hypothetical protein
MTVLFDLLFVASSTKQLYCLPKNKNATSVGRREKGWTNR